MSTRAVYGFKDDRGTHWVYVHHDGYPTGAADKFAKTLKSGLVWPLPRFEANEFATGFVAANKTNCGGVRLTPGPGAHGDIEYVYVVAMIDGRLRITAGYPHPPLKTFFTGLLNDFITDARDIEASEGGKYD